MNNLKKVGLTALGTAMISTGANAATMDVSGGTSIFFNGENNSHMGNGWAMTDSITFSASGEMDNGWTVSTSIEMDSGGGNITLETIDASTLGNDLALNASLPSGTSTTLAYFQT